MVMLYASAPSASKEERVAQWPRASMASTTVRDDELWDEVARDPALFIMRLREKGEIMPREGQLIAMPPAFLLPVFPLTASPSSV